MKLMLRLDLLCTSTLPINRPSVREVVEMLLLCNPDEKIRKAVAARLPPHLRRNPNAFTSKSTFTSSSAHTGVYLFHANTCGIDM